MCTAHFRRILINFCRLCESVSQSLLRAFFFLFSLPFVSPTAFETDTMVQISDSALNRNGSRIEKCAHKFVESIDSDYSRKKVFLFFSVDYIAAPTTINLIFEKCSSSCGWRSPCLLIYCFFVCLAGCAISGNGISTRRSGTGEKSSKVKKENSKKKKMLLQSDQITVRPKHNVEHNAEST